MRWEEGEASLPLFHLPIVPRAFNFLLSPGSIRHKEASAKSNGYNQRYTKKRKQYTHTHTELYTRRGAWRVVRDASLGQFSIAISLNVYNLISIQFYFFRVDISGLQIMEYFSHVHKLHFLVTFEYKSACIYAPFDGKLDVRIFQAPNKCVTYFVPFAVE